MSYDQFTTQEILSEIEGVIEKLRPVAFRESDHRRLLIYKAIANDLRGRLDGAPTVALLELERRLSAALRSKTRLGYAQGPMIGVAEEVIGRWPTIKQALEKFGAEQ